MNRPTRPVISGCSILETLDHFDKQEDLGVVYHGTPLALDELHPRNCKLWLNDRLIPDTDLPVVCASDNPTIAAFRALVPRTDRMFGCNRVRNKEGGLTFYIPETHKSNMMGAIGYAALCDKEDFSPYTPQLATGATIVGEFRSWTPVIPLCNVEIDYTDFECLLYADSRNELIYT
jgi:hypothetical protein